MSSLSPMGSLPEAPWALELCSEDPSLSPDSLSSSLILTASLQHDDAVGAFCKNMPLCNILVSFS